MTSEKLIKVANILDAHGIKGEVKLLSFVENPDFFKINSVLTDSTGKKTFTIKITGTVKNALIVKIDGVNDRNTAELLKNTALFAPSSTLPSLADDEFYHSELIGLEARSENGENYDVRSSATQAAPLNGASPRCARPKIGTVTAIHNYGAGDIVEITTISGESEMLPLTTPWVGEINIKQGFITVTLAEYL